LVENTAALPKKKIDLGIVAGIGESRLEIFVFEWRICRIKDQIEV
jgi:hypothetical protein